MRVGDEQRELPRRGGDLREATAHALELRAVAAREGEAHRRPVRTHEVLGDEAAGVPGGAEEDDVVIAG